MIFAAMRRTYSLEVLLSLAVLLRWSNRVTVPSVMVLLAAGITMVLTTWGFATAWIDVSLGGVVLLATFNALVTEPRMHAIAHLALSLPNTQDVFPPPLKSLIQNRLLSIAMALQVPYILGIVFLMVTKPTLGISLGIMGAALLIGIIIYSLL